MTYDEARQYLKLIADEINIKRVVFLVMNTDKGKLEIVYKADLDDLCLELNGEKVLSPRLNDMIANMVEDAFNQIAKKLI